jgi:hypothetical protein
MNFFSGEKGYHPDSKDYVDSYVLFYARRLGLEGNYQTPKEIDEKLVVSAKTHLLDDLYKNLDTIDSKASALLAFCGLILASISLFLSSPNAREYDSILYILFLSVVVSAVLAITVIDIHWTNPRDLRGRTLESACMSYYTTRRKRTARYRSAWFLTFASVLVLGGYVAIDLLRKLAG